ncbi:MAG: oligosaccharide flippase family protein [Clostridia bacterium]|nr:oligosaccharide flippase family protein [Clostridia bacterium]
MKKSLRLCNKNKMSVGVIILIVSGVVCKILGAVFRLPLTNTLGVEAIGKFQVVMAFYAFALVFVSGGITSAVSKMIGKARAQYENLNAKQLLLKATKNSCLFAFVFGVLFFVVGLFLERIYGNFVSMCCGLFVVLLPLGVCLSALRGVFQGFQEMTPTAISQIVEQVFKFAFGLWFAFLFQKASADAGVFGAFLGIVLSEIVSVVLLLIW